MRARDYFLTLFIGQVARVCYHGGALDIVKTPLFLRGEYQARLVAGETTEFRSVNTCGDQAYFFAGFLPLVCARRRARFKGMSLSPSPTRTSASLTSASL